MFKEMGLAQSVLCDFCIPLERDSLQHCMCRCEHVKSFWNELEKFLFQNCEKVHNFKFKENIILFATEINFKSGKILDLNILSANFGIYSCRQGKHKQTNKNTIMRIQKRAGKKKKKKGTILKHVTRIETEPACFLIRLGHL